MNENTIKDLGTLNRGQSMLLNLYIKSYTHVTLHVYTYYIELTVYAPTKTGAVLVTPFHTSPSLYCSSPTNWWQGYRSPQGVTAMYSVPEPQPEMRL